MFDGCPVLAHLATAVRGVGAVGYDAVTGDAAWGMSSVYGFYGGQDPSHQDIRRVPATSFVAAGSPPRDCSVGC